MKEMQLERILCEYASARIGIYKVWAEESHAEAVPTLHAHETYEIHTVTDGAYTFTVEGEAVPLHAKQFLILKPGTEHYSYDGTGNCSLVSLHLSLERTEEADGFYPYFRRALDGAAGVPHTASPALVQSMTGFASVSAPLTVNAYCRLQVLASQIVYHLFSDIDRFGEDQTCLKSTHRVHSVAYLIECLVNDPSCTLADISARTGYSPRHTTRLIQSMYGKTLREIRMERSVDHAKTLLRTTGKTVETIAAETGFASAAAMRRAFLQAGNAPPSTYRCRDAKNSDSG